MLWRETLALRAFGFFKIPLLWFVGPRVVEFTGEKCVIDIPLGWRTKNHLGAMYFGVLAAGADCAGGLLAMRLIQKSGRDVSLVFKDFQAQFLKRAEGTVRFSCAGGKEVSEFVTRVLQSPERLNHPVQVIATVPSSSTPDEPVALFTLTLSLKRRD